MTTRTSLNTTRYIVGLAQRLKVTLPKPFTTRAAELEALDVHVRKLARNVEHVSVPNTILDVMEAGDDPFDDSVVHEALIHEQVAALANGVQFAFDTRVESFLAEHAESVLMSFAGHVTKLGKTFVSARESLGGVEMDDLKAIISKGGNAAQVWADVSAAERELTEVLAVRGHLSLVAGSGIRNPGQYRALTIADIPPEVLIGQQLGNTMPSGWDITRNGWTLSLASTLELQNRIDAVVSAQSGAESRWATEQRRAETKHIRMTA